MSEVRRPRDASRSAEYVTICGDVAYVELAQGVVSVIDAADAAEVGKSLWRLSVKGYAMTDIKTNGKWTSLRLHRLLLDPPLDMQIDHINGDRLDNRRANLRICSHSENQRNSRPAMTYGGKRVFSQYKGVYASGSRFRAQIGINWKQVRLGTFDTAEEAALAYDGAAREHFGEFARTNFQGGNR